jgi:hypothetical protein
MMAYARPREAFLQGELKFIDFQDPAPEYILSADARTGIKDHFVSIFNRAFASIIRLDYEAERIERAISARELASDAEQLRIKLAHARTRLTEARASLNSIKLDFEKLLVADSRTTPRTRLGRIRMRFEKEINIPLRNAHTTLISVAIKLKEIR